MSEHQPNYGDVALNLPPDWDRYGVVTNQGFLVTTVGHVNGKADLYLTEKPWERHQFYWASPEDQQNVNIQRGKHYRYVTKTDWSKNEELWEWDGEGYVVYAGQRAMAREAQWYIKEKEEQERLEAEASGKRAVDADEERAMRKLESRGVTITDDRGRQLTPLSPKQEKRARG